MRTRFHPIAIAVTTILFAIVGCVIVLTPLISMNETDGKRVQIIAPESASAAVSESGSSDRSLDDQHDLQEMMPAPSTYQRSPAGICEAVRSGDLELIKAILSSNPELLSATNPHNWANLPEMRVYPWAKYPVEIAVIFGRDDVLAYLLSISATEDDPIGGYHDAFEIARKAENQSAINTIANDAIRRVTERPELATHASENGRTFLHFAAENMHVGLMEELLELGADPAAVTKNGTSPIHYVVGDNEQTQLLLKYGIDHTLWIAAAMNDFERARDILAEDPSEVAVDFHPASHHSDGLPMVQAAVRGYTEMVRLLLDHGADVNGSLAGREFGGLGFALIESFSAGHYDVVNLLLDRGADTRAWVDSDHDFKRRVKDSDHQQIKDRVLTAEEQNPPIKSPSFVAWTGEITGNIRDLPAPTPGEALGAISAAIVSHNRHNDYENYKEIITVMLEQGADQNASMNPTQEEIEAVHPRHRNRFGTPLHWLATEYLNKQNYSPNPDIPTTEELVDLAALFIEFDADIEARHPVTNHTPLSSAVQEGAIDYVRFLLEKRAVVNSNDPPETNPVIIAGELGFEEIAELLK